MDTNLCEYCHEHPPKYLVAGRWGSRWDKICQACYDAHFQPDKQPIIGVIRT